MIVRSSDTSSHCVLLVLGRCFVVLPLYYSYHLTSLVLITTTRVQPQLVDGVPFIQSPPDFAHCGTDAVHLSQAPSGLLSPQNAKYLVHHFPPIPRKMKGPDRPQAIYVFLLHYSMSRAFRPFLRAVQRV